MASCSSLEDHYHGGISASVSIPFTWESQPGTPKAKFSQNPTLPPLTPPPSYYYTKTKRVPLRKSYSNSLLLQHIFPKKHSASRKAATPSSSPTSSPSLRSSSSSSSASSSTTYYSVPSSPVTPAKFRARGRSVSSPKVLAADSRMHFHDDQYEDYGSRVSTTGCYSHFIKVLLRKFH